MEDDRVVVLLPASSHPHLIEATHAASRRVDVTFVSMDAPPPPEAEHAHVFYRPVAFRGPALDAIMEAARNLRWVHVPAAGVDASIFPALRDRGIMLTHSEGTYDMAVGEFAMALVVSGSQGPHGLRTGAGRQELAAGRELGGSGPSSSRSGAIARQDDWGCRAGGNRPGRGSASARVWDAGVGLSSVGSARSPG